MSATLHRLVSQPELLGRIDTLRGGLAAMAELFAQADEIPAPHQVGDLFEIFALAAKDMMGDAAPPG